MIWIWFVVVNLLLGVVLLELLIINKIKHKQAIWRENADSLCMIAQYCRANRNIDMHVFSTYVEKAAEHMDVVFDHATWFDQIKENEKITDDIRQVTADHYVQEALNSKQR